VAAETPLAEVASKWIAASHEDRRHLFGRRLFSFARDLHRDLRVPIGLINASWGGKMIEVFMSAEALASDPAFSAVKKRWLRNSAAAGAARRL